MRGTFVGLCVAATITYAPRAEAQPGRQGRETRQEETGIRAREGGHRAVTTATGCLQPGSTPHAFVLRDEGTPAGQARAGITLVAPGAVDVSSYIGQRVQVSGVMSPRGGPAERGAAAAEVRITVRDIRPLAGSCGSVSPATGSVVDASGVTNPAPPATGPAAGSGTTTSTSGSSGQTGVSGDALLDGLINFNIQQLLVSIQFVTNVQDTVINVTDVLNDFQIQALVQLLNSNPVASLNATELSLALQQSGLLAPGETVVGVTPPTIRDNKTLTTALQHQGILQPGERVVGAKGARIYKMTR